MHFSLLEVKCTTKQIMLLSNTVSFAEDISVQNEVQVKKESVVPEFKGPHYKFYKKCKANNIKPVIGLEVKINSTLENKNCVLLYAKNIDGYHNLIKL